MDAESFDADAGDNCPYCYCEHKNLSVDSQPPYFDGEVAWVEIQCDDCNMKATAPTYEFEFDKQGILEEVGLPIAVNMMNPNYGTVRCSRCHERFEKSAEGLEFTDWAKQEHHGKKTSLKDWADHEIKTHGKSMSFQDWAKHEDKSHIDRFGAESFSAESFIVYGEYKNGQRIKLGQSATARGAKRIMNNKVKAGVLNFEKYETYGFENANNYFVNQDAYTAESFSAESYRCRSNNKVYQRVGRKVENTRLLSGKSVSYNHRACMGCGAGCWTNNRIPPTEHNAESLSCSVCGISTPSPKTEMDCHNSCIEIGMAYERASGRCEVCETKDIQGAYDMNHNENDPEWIIVCADCHHYSLYGEHNAESFEAQAPRGHKMMTKELGKKIPPLYSQDGKGDEAIVYAHYFNPYGVGEWWILEWDGENEMFGYADLGFPELGYISLSELENVSIGGMELPIERDLHWREKTLGEVKQAVSKYRAESFSGEMDKQYLIGGGSVIEEDDACPSCKDGVMEEGSDSYGTLYLGCSKCDYGDTTPMSDLSCPGSDSFRTYPQADGEHSWEPESWSCEYCNLVAPRFTPPEKKSAESFSATKGIDTFTEPFDELSLDSGNIKKVIVGIGIGVAAILAYNKWK